MYAASHPRKNRYELTAFVIVTVIAALVAMPPAKAADTDRHELARTRILNHHISAQPGNDATSAAAVDNHERARRVILGVAIGAADQRHALTVKSQDGRDPHGNVDQHDRARRQILGLPLEVRS